MIRFFSEKFESLKVRILGGILFIFVLAMSMVMYGVWTYQRDKLLELSSQRAMALSDVIVAGLRSSMLQNDRELSMQSINTILRVAGTSRISVLNPSGKVSMSSDPAMIGKILDRKTCDSCHARGKNPERTILLERGGEKFVSTATVISNETACHKCHAAEHDINGILLVESSFAETEAMLRQMAERIAMTGLFGLGVGILLLNYIIVRFFTSPLGLLQKGFEQVGQGNFDYWVDVRDGGEIGQMADAFNVMSRALSRFVKEIKEKTGEVTAHYMIVNSLSRTIERKALKEVVVDLLMRLFEADCVSMAHAVERYSHVFELVKIQQGDKRHYHGYYDTDEGEIEMCALTRGDLLSWAGGEFASLKYVDDGAKLLMPIHHEKIAIGIVSVVKKDGEKFRGSEKKIMPILAQHIAVSLANAQLYHMAITDGLTTLYTKRYFEKKIKDFVENYHTARRGFCLLILDLDHFKEVNDRYGHPVGDHVLMRFGELVRSHVRHGDIPFRYGGEEFAVILRGDQIEDAVRTAERIRQGAERMMIEVDGVEPFARTVSIGIACFPHHFTRVEDLINAADSALYEAKDKGRNLVVVYCGRKVN